MTKPKVVVTHWVHPQVLDCLSTVAEIEPNPTRDTWPRAEVERRCRDASGMMAFMPDIVDAAFLEACPHLAIVACALKGFDNFDLEACKRAGVAVSFVPDLLTAPTAELAIGLAVGLQRNIRAGDAFVRSGQFEGWRPVLYGAGLDGATVAIIGLGAVGAAIAARLSGFGCRIVGHDPSAPPPAGVTALPLAEALAIADLVILAAPLTGTTRHMIGDDALRGFRPGARLVNVGRGSVVDEDAVAAALETGQLGGYAADVFAFEDWALADRPRAIPPRLMQHPQTLFTPHLGSAVDGVRLAIAMRAAEALVDHLSGRVPRDLIA